MEQLKVYEKVFQVDFRDVPKNREYAGVIVEPREHRDLEFVLKNFHYMLPDWSLYIFHSEENADFVRGILGTNHQVTLIPFTHGNIDIAGYNKLLMSEEFYDTVNAEKMLVFQCDTFIRKKVTHHTMYRLPFIQYDYVGAPWAAGLGIPPSLGISTPVQVGNGGLSLRTTKVMKHIIQNYQHVKDTIQSNSLHAPELCNEDVFFSTCTTMMDDCIKCTPSMAAAFSVEHCFHPDPFGWHQAYRHQGGWKWEILKSINIT